MSWVPTTARSVLILTMSESVAILYGWAEGPRHAKLLRSELRAAGFEIRKRASKADAVIAHSGGAMMLPRRLNAQLVLLVGLPYWPGRHPIQSLPRKVKMEFENPLNMTQWLKKTFYNGLYSLRPRHHYKMSKAFRHKRYPDASKDCSFIAIRNRHDPFMHPEKTVELAEEKAWSLLSLPGTHDDIWANPRPYIAIIKKSLANVTNKN